MHFLEKSFYLDWDFIEIYFWRSHWKQSVLVQVMAWGWIGDQPLLEPMLVRFIDALIFSKCSASRLVQIYLYYENPALWPQVEMISLQKVESYLKLLSQLILQVPIRHIYIRDMILVITVEIMMTSTVYEIDYELATYGYVTMSQVRASPTALITTCENYITL